MDARYVVKRDARFLPAAAQEELRIRVVKAVEGGLSQREAAELFGVSKQSVCGWWKSYRVGGLRALRSARRGRRLGDQRVLSAGQERTVAAVIGQLTPDQVGLEHVLWSRQAVVDLIADWYGIGLTPQGVGLYLRRWGFTPQKPQRRTVEQDPKAVAEWLEETYPTIAGQADRDGAEIVWLDETGARGDHTAGRSFAPRGHTPVILGTGKRFRANVIAAMSNTGHLYFQIFTTTFNAVLFCGFLARLARAGHGRPVYVITDGHPTHRAGEVTDWLAGHPQVRLFFLPTYSPELNPMELLNQDLKANAVGRRRPRALHQMTTNLRSRLHRRQRQPQIIRHYFEEPHVRYAA